MKIIIAILLLYLLIKAFWSILPEKKKLIVATKLLREHDPKLMEQLERWRFINGHVFTYYNNQLKLNRADISFHNKYTKFSNQAKSLTILMQTANNKISSIDDSNIREIESIFNEVLDDHIDVIPELKSLKRNSTLDELGIK
jgi:hypothetical protein